MRVLLRDLSRDLPLAGLFAGELSVRMRDLLRDRLRDLLRGLPFLYGSRGLEPGLLYGCGAALCAGVVALLFCVGITLLLK